MNTTAINEEGSEFPSAQDARATEAGTGVTRKPPPRKALYALVAAAVLLLAVACVAMLRSPKHVQTPNSAVPAAALKNIPGDAAATPNYDQKQQAANAEEAKLAQQTGASNLPTLTKGDIVRSEPQPPEPAPLNSGHEPADHTNIEVERRLKLASEFWKNDRLASESRNAQMLVFPESPTLVPSSAIDRDRQETIAEGTSFYARIERLIDSDHPGPVHAIIVGDTKLAGKRIVGTFELQAEKVRLPFTSLVDTASGKTQKITALAFDPTNTGYGVVAEVDRHLLQRYGGMFLAALAKATPTLLAPRTTVTQQLASGAISQSSTRATESDIGKAVLADGIGQIGSDIAAASRRPTTVRVMPGDIVGVVLTAPLTLERQNE